MFLFSDFTRCGTESGQCIHMSDMCNGIRDCVNNWDEAVEQCVNDTEQGLFVSESA